jgi:hypothetical protein
LPGLRLRKTFAEARIFESVLRAKLQDYSRGESGLRACESYLGLADAGQEDFRVRIAPAKLHRLADPSDAATQDHDPCYFIAFWELRALNHHRQSPSGLSKHGSLGFKDNWEWRSRAKEEKKPDNGACRRHGTHRATQTGLNKKPRVRLLLIGESATGFMGMIFPGEARKFVKQFQQDCNLGLQARCGFVPLEAHQPPRMEAAPSLQHLPPEHARRALLALPSTASGKFAPHSPQALKRTCRG